MEKTHYDTLKVSRDAPVEVVRAAYRVLSQMYHPDRHPEDPAAAAAMGRLNQAYAVLSDVEQRRAYDLSIGEIKTRAPRAATSKTTDAHAIRADSRREVRNGVAPMVPHGPHWLLYGSLFAAVAMALVGGAVLLLPARGPQLDSALVAAPPPEDRDAYIRRLAREVMLPHADDVAPSAVAPAASSSAVSPSGDPPASEMEQEVPVRPVQGLYEYKPSGRNDGVGSVPAFDGQTGSAPAIPSASASIETQIPTEWSSPGQEQGETPAVLRSGIGDEGQHLR